MNQSNHEAPLKQPLIENIQDETLESRDDARGETAEPIGWKKKAAAFSGNLIEM